MSDDMQRWLADGRDNNWTMPVAPKWMRLPVIRHIRASWNSIQVARQAAFYSRLGMIQSGYDQWVLWGMARGLERDE